MTYGAGLHLIADDLGDSDELPWLEQAELDLEGQALVFLAPRAAFADFLLEQGIP